MQAFRDCGWAAYGMAFLGMLGLAAAFVSVLVTVLSSRALAPLVTGSLASLLGLSALGVAPVAVMHGHSVVDAAVSGASLNPSQRERIRAEGYREAGECVDVGGASGTLPLLGGLPAIVIAIRRRKRAARG